MARKKKEEAPQGLAEWMATYSDMVTLLMCFFVLLYASSTPDETKWQYIFQAFNTTGTYINPFVTEENENTTEETENDDGNSQTPANGGQGTQDNESEDSMGLPSNFDELYAWFAAKVESSGLESSVSVEQSSSSRIHIRFNNSIMFDGDSAVLLDSGKDALNLFLPGIKAIDKYVKNLLVQGHTSQGISLINDWDLSAARACSVTKYIDFKRVIDSDKFIAEGHGPYDPVNMGTTAEELAQNRRVELVIVRNDVALNETSIIQDILKYDYGINQAITDPSTGQPAGTDTLDDTVQQIITGLDDKYGSHDGVEDSENTDYSGPEAGETITEIPDSILQEVDENGAVVTEETAAEETTAS